MGEYSANNIIPLYFGDVEYKMHRERIRRDLYYEHSIWKYLKERGFITSFVCEVCNWDYSRYIGENPTVDHISSYFMCAAAKYNDYQANMEA
jgi:hypothetical protein